MFDLTAYNTFGLRVRAREGLLIRSTDDLRRLGARDEYIVLGSGSDVLFTDDFEGKVVINALRGIRYDDVDDDTVAVTVQGGENLDTCIGAFVERNLHGLENLSAIPGSMGAAPVQNVGAYGVEIGEFISAVEVYSPLKQQLYWIPGSECGFGYRTSIFKQHPEDRLFITAVRLQLSRRFAPRLSYAPLCDFTPRSGRELREHIIALRRRKLPDPRVVGNAGSFFKNPITDGQRAIRLKNLHPDLPLYPAGDGLYKLPAAWLIDHAGCKGITHGRAGTWENQALVLVNRGEAAPYEIVELGKYIVTEVERTFGISLEPEVRIFGRHGEIAWSSLKSK